MPFFSQVMFLASLSALVMGASYSRTDSYSGSGLLSNFDVESISDPTHGRVYVRETARVFVHPLTLVSLQKLRGCIHCGEQESDLRFWGYIYPPGRLQDHFKLQWAWPKLGQDPVQETIYYLRHDVRTDAHISF